MILKVLNLLNKLKTAESRGIKKKIIRLTVVLGELVRGNYCKKFSRKAVVHCYDVCKSLRLYSGTK